MIKRTFSIQAAVILLLLCSVNFPVSSQFLRTSFLMKDAHYRTQLNPALLPSKGYVDIPVIGNFNLSLLSDPIGSRDVLDILNNDKNIATDDNIYNNLLKDLNRMNLALNTDVIAAGWWKGDNFWSINAGLRADFGVLVPKSMFTFLRDMDNISNLDGKNYRLNIEDEKLDLNVYTEIGVGFARELNERLTVGGKFKLLLGMGNLSVNINQIHVETNGDGDISEDAYWENGGTAKLIVDAAIEGSLSGMEFTKGEDGFINDFEFNGFGIGGYGGAVDLGAAYKVMDNLTLSAAVNDLGFISWSKGSSNIFTAEASRDYNVENYREFLDIVDESDILNFDLFGFKHEEKTKSRATSLYSTITAGGEYTLLDDKIALGLLSTTRVLKPKTLTELTFGAAYRPKGWFNLAASYSVIQSAGASFGLAMMMGPLFIGTDYMYLGNNTKAINAFIGVSVPLSGKKNI